MKLILFLLLSLTVSIGIAFGVEYEFKTLSGANSLSLSEGQIAKVISVSDGVSGWLKVEEMNGFQIVRSAFYGKSEVSLIGTIFVGSAKITSHGGRTFTFAIENNGSTTLIGKTPLKNESTEDSQQASNSLVPDPNKIQYDRLFGWCYFTDTPWIYSYTNGSWYYINSSSGNVYVWNANLPDNGWMKLGG